ncbi:MAG: hypothetical protein M3Q40_05765 [Pseudomonadota bacterium]|nr:hypothetical protein [Pseudomonadota bacterium]
MNTPQDRYTAGQTTGSSTTASGVNAQGAQPGSQDVDLQKQQAREQVGELADTIKTESRAKVEELKDTARTEGKAKVEEYRSVAASKVDRLADSVKAAASELEGDEDIGQLSRYISDAAEKIHRFSEGLRTRNGDDIMRDAARMARENPALFIGGSIAIGFGLARFARAAQPPHHQLSHDESSQHTSPYGDTYRQGAGSPSSGSTAGFGSEFSNTGTSSAGTTGSASGTTGSAPGASSTLGSGTRGSDLSGTSGLAGSSTATGSSGLGASTGSTGSSSIGTSSTPGSATGSSRSTRDMSSDSDNGQGRKPS